MPEIIVKLGDNIVHKYVFDKEIMNIGRGRDNDIVIENLSVSRNHARIRREGDRYILTDLNSANGTYVNGVRVTRVEVVDEDVITVGKHKLLFQDKKETAEEAIGEAYAADRTMMVEQMRMAMLAVTKGKQAGQTFQLTKYETYIGRSSENDVRLHDWFVSKKHALITRHGAAFKIQDLGSWRGTLVNGRTVRECELAEGDEIQLGTTSLRFTFESEIPEPQAEGRVPQELAYEEEAPAGAVSVSVTEEQEPSAARAASLEAAAEPEPATPGAHREGADEFAPLSEEELAALEAEEKEALGAAQPAPAAPADVFGSLDLAEPPAEEALYAEEEAFAQAFEKPEDSGIVIPAGLEERAGESEEDAAALEGRAASAPEPLPAPPPPAPAPAPAPVAETPATPPPSTPVSVAAASLSPEEVAKEVALWEAALKNPSKVIRRQAARKLKKLTGRDYDWESSPE